MKVPTPHSLIPGQSLMLRGVIATVLALGAIFPVALHGQAATTQVWTGITPPPANGTVYTFAEITGGVWDASTASWANAAPGSMTDYYAFAAGNGRIATFLPKTGGYTVTLAYDTTVLRALSISGGNTSGQLTIQSDAGHKITFNGTNSYINIAPGRTLTIGANTALVGSHNFQGGGTLIWSGAATAFGGTVNVSGGKWIVQSDAASRFGGASAVVLNGGHFEYNGSSAYSSGFAVNSGRLSGSGSFASAVAIGGGTVISPGAGVGSQRYETLVVDPGATYEWQLNRWLGTDAGMDYDLLDLGELTLNPGGTTLAIRLQSLGADGEEGVLADFDGTTDRLWTLIEVDGELDVASFTLDTSAFEALHETLGGEFALVAGASTLQLRYAAAIPEPGSLLLVAGAFSGLWILRWQRQRRDRIGNSQA